MNSPDQLFRRPLKELRLNLTAQGFRRSGQNFVIDSAECWGIINLQKSRYSLPEQQKFTINLAIAAKRILRFYGEPADRAPRHFTCHWQIRIGQLIPGTLDHWWVLSDEKSYAPAAAEVMQLVTTKAVGLIQEHLSERGLLQLWDTYLGFELPDSKVQVDPTGGAE